MPAPKIRDSKLRDYAAQNPSAHGGAYQNTRRGRERRRPLCTVQSVHLTLRSSRATGPQSFRRPQHRARIQQLVQRFSKKFLVRVYSAANVGNHLHLHIKLGQERSYKKFIRALTAAIAMYMQGTGKGRPSKAKFWDLRPFTRLVNGIKQFTRLETYIEINELEGYGIPRSTARWYLDWCERGKPLWG